MKLLTTTLAVALLSQIGTAHAGDDVYVIYSNNTKYPVEILYDRSSVCMYQDEIPNDVLVPPGQDFGPYYAETNEQFLTSTCSGGDITLDIILHDGSQNFTQCTFSQYGYGRPFVLAKCTGSQNIRVSLSESHQGGFATSEETLLILFGDKPSTSSHVMVKPPLTEVQRYNTSKVNPMMNQRKTMNQPQRPQLNPHKMESHLSKPVMNQHQRAIPHLGHEIEHYDTSRVNPMMHQHKMEFHRPEPMMMEHRPGIQKMTPKSPHFKK